MSHSPHGSPIPRRFLQWAWRASTNAVVVFPDPDGPKKKLLLGTEPFLICWPSLCFVPELPTRSRRKSARRLSSDWTINPSLLESANMTDFPFDRDLVLRKPRFC